MEFGISRFGNTQDEREKSISILHKHLSPKNAIVKQYSTVTSKLNTIMAYSIRCVYTPVRPVPQSKSLHETEYYSSGSKRGSLMKNKRDEMEYDNRFGIFDRRMDI